MKQLFFGFLVLLAGVFMSRMAFGEESKVCCPKYKVVTKVVEKIVYVDKVVLVDKPMLITKEVIVEKEVVKKVGVMKKNNLSLLLGRGPVGIDRTGNRVDLYSDTVAGIGYIRTVGSTLTLGAQIQTNSTLLGSVGMDF